MTNPKLTPQEIATEIKKHLKSTEEALQKEIKDYEGNEDTNCIIPLNVGEYTYQAELPKASLMKQLSTKDLLEELMSRDDIVIIGEVHVGEDTCKRKIRVLKQALDANELMAPSKKYKKSIIGNEYYTYEDEPIQDVITATVYDYLASF